MLHTCVHLCYQIAVSYLHSANKCVLTYIVGNVFTLAKTHTVHVVGRLAEELDALQLHHNETDWPIWESDTFSLHVSFNLFRFGRDFSCMLKVKFKLGLFAGNEANYNVK